MTQVAYLELAFWICAAGAVYSYFLYPLLLVFLPKRRKDRIVDEGLRPAVSVIIAAHNEEHRIADKLRNTLACEYPREQLEIIVASDASTDGTSAIVWGFAAEGVRLIEAAERKGKEHAQGLAVQAAQGEILVFSDAGCSVRPDCLQQLVRNFADDRIGAVSSEDRLLTRDGKLAGEGAYLKYEMWLRRLESSAGTLIGLTGALFAIRRELCQQWDRRIDSDFNAALACVRHGKAAVSDERVLCFYADVEDPRREYRRKVRTILRGLGGVACAWPMLNPLRYGLAAVQLWSHKIARWVAPWFFLAAGCLSVVLFREAWVYRAALAAQLVFYGAACLGMIFPKLRSILTVRIACFFVLSNAAIVHATLAFLAGKQVITWEPSRRDDLTPTVCRH